MRQLASTISIWAMSRRGIAGLQPHSLSYECNYRVIFIINVNLARAFSFCVHFAVAYVICLVLSVTKCTVEKLNNLNVYRKNGEDPSLMHQLIHHHPNLSTSNCHSLGPLLLRFLQSHLTAYEKAFFFS